MGLTRLLGLINGNIISKKKLRELNNSEDNLIRYRKGTLKKDDQGMVIFSTPYGERKIYSSEGKYSRVTAFSI